eukprot:g5760.t1
MAAAGPYHSTALAVLSLLAFVSAALLSAGEARTQRREDKLGLSIAWWRAPSVLPFCLAVSFTVRCIWIVLRGLVDPRKEYDVAEQVVNRIALLFYFTGYSFVVALVMDRVRVQAKGFLSTAGTSRTWANLWRGVVLVWLISFATTLWWALKRSNRVTRYFLPALFFLMSLLFLRYGLRLHALHRSNGGAHRPTYWLAVAACASAVLFFVRFALYLYEAAAGTFLNGGGAVYPYFFYEVPELVPGALILLAMRRLRAQSAGQGSLRRAEADDEVDGAVVAALGEDGGGGSQQQRLIISNPQ